MSSAVWKFERSVDEIVDKLSDIVQCENTSQIKMEWSYRGELCMEPAGWDALWRIPKGTCHKLDVRFPCVVYVTVESLDLECHENADDIELNATVQVIGVQDDEIHLPAKHEAVPISELWPLIRQPNGAIDVKTTADFIDLYRYFYTYIWMPWDMDWEDACRSWFQNNVRSRVTMWANAGIKVHELRTIRDEARNLSKQIVKCQSELPSDTEDDNPDLSGSAVTELMLLHEKMQQFRYRWQSYQNPTVLRQESRNNGPPKNISIWTGGSVESYITHLREVNNSLKTTGDLATISLDCSPSLEAAMTSGPPQGSKLFLCPGEHSLPADNVFGNDLTVKSVTNDVKLVCREERSAALAVIGSLTLEGVQISAEECSTVVSLRSGDVEMHQCEMKGNESDVRSQGLIVFPGTQLKLKKCNFLGFFTGIMVHNGGMVILDSCTFSECGVGLQVTEGAKVSISNCVFAKCLESGIRFDSQNVPYSLGGKCSILEPYSSDISCLNCTFVDNTLHDAYVAKIDENTKHEWENAEADSL